jgi:putative transposase
MDGRKDTAVETLLEHLIEHGPSDIATVFGRAFELAMQIERELASTEVVEFSV